METQLNMNELYKKLKTLDSYVLKNFCKGEIDDAEYFHYGIYSDIISNSLSIIINYFSDNLGSAGVDCSCRSIIEAMVILKMDSEGKITNKQKTIYRYLYAYVDLDNFHSDLTQDVKEKNIFKLVLSDKEKAKQAMMDHFKCRAKDLNNRKIGIDDPCFYLKRDLKEKIKFSKLIEEYPVGQEKTTKMYQFFSLFIHPRCEVDQEYEDQIMDLRNNYIFEVLKLVSKFIEENQLSNGDLHLNDFNEDFYLNPLLKNNLQTIEILKQTFKIIEKSICEHEEGTDRFTLFFLRRIKGLIVDMMISLSLGYKEHGVAIFKPFVEEFGVFSIINSIEDRREFIYKKKGFLYISMLQMCLHLLEVGARNVNVPVEEIEEIYKNFYKENYNIDKFDDFYEEFKANSLYFLFNERKSYNKVVKKYVTECFGSNAISKNILDMYRVSKDLSHASGYSFNSSVGMIDASSQRALLTVWEIIFCFLLNVSQVLREKNKENDLKPCIDLFSELIKMQSAELGKIYKSYADLVKDIDKREQKNEDK